MIYDTISPTAEKIVLREGKTWLTSEELSRNTCRKALFGFGDKNITDKKQRWGIDKAKLPNSSQQDNYTSSNSSSDTKIRGCYVKYTLQDNKTIEDRFLLNGKHGVHIRKEDAITTLWRFQNETKDWEMKFVYWFSKANFSQPNRSRTATNTEVKLWRPDDSQNNIIYPENELSLEDNNNTWRIRYKNKSQQVRSAVIDKSGAQTQVKQWLQVFKDKKGEWITSSKERCDLIRNERSPNAKDLEIAREWCSKSNS